MYVKVRLSIGRICIFALWFPVYAWVVISSIKLNPLSGEYNVFDTSIQMLILRSLLTLGCRKLGNYHFSHIHSHKIPTIQQVDVDPDGMKSKSAERECAGLFCTTWPRYLKKRTGVITVRIHTLQEYGRFWNFVSIVRKPRAFI